MQKWDSMLQSMEVLEHEPRQYPILRIGTFLNTYGVPGDPGIGSKACGTVIQLICVMQGYPAVESLKHTAVMNFSGSLNLCKQALAQCQL